MYRTKYRRRHSACRYIPPFSIRFRWKCAFENTADEKSGTNKKRHTKKNTSELNRIMRYNIHILLNMEATSTQIMKFNAREYCACRAFATKCRLCARFHKHSVAVLTRCEAQQRPKNRSKWINALKMESHCKSANSKCSACDVHRVKMRKTEWTKETEIKKEKKQHRSHNFFEGIFSVGFHFANAIYVFNVILTRQRNSKRAQRLRSSNSSEFAWKHSHCYLEHENSHAIQIPLMKKKPTSIDFFFARVHSSSAGIKNDTRNNSANIPPLLRFGPCESGNVFEFLRYIKFERNQFFCFSLCRSLARFSSFAAIYFQWLLVSLSYAE